MEKLPTAEEFLPKNSNGMYSRNEVEKAFELGVKWQQEQEKNKYSEEEVTQLLIKFNQEIYEVEDVRGWFEQFKKK